MPSRLYPEDQERVDAYLNQPENRVKRKPFNVWLLLGVILGAVIGMGLLGVAVYVLGERIGTTDPVADEAVTTEGGGQ